MTSREPEIPTDEPSEPWIPDEGTGEAFEVAPDAPDDPPDQPLLDEETVEPELDLEAPDDADDRSWQLDPAPLDEEFPSDPTEPIILSWRETAHLPDHGVDLPAVLDPTAATSTWIVPVFPPVASLRLHVTIGMFETHVEVTVREGRTPELRLGRDALGGKVLIRP